MNFEDWLYQQGIVLQPWAKEASSRFFAVMYQHRYGATGKSFLVGKMAEYARLQNRLSFAAWIEERAVALQPWQKEAADAFFVVERMPLVSGIEPSNIFLILKIFEFVNLYGNCFEIGIAQKVAA